MITIKKLKKLNELFTFDGNNIFDYTTKNGNDYLFTDDNGTEYRVLLDSKKLNNKLKILDIEYGINSPTQTIIEPIKGKLDNNKLKVFNTVLNIIKEKIESFDPEIITFSGNTQNGLANFYSMLIKSLKLKDYKVYNSEFGAYKNFTLIKDFDFIDCVNVIYYQQKGNIFKIEYIYDGLSIELTDYRNDIDIDFNLEKVIKFCIPDKETITDSWTDDGDGWVKIFLYIYSDNIDITNSDIQKTIQYIESLGLVFHRHENREEIVFYDPEKVK